MMILSTWGRERTHGRGSDGGGRGRSDPQSHLSQSCVTTSVTGTSVCKLCTDNKPARHPQSVASSKLHVSEVLLPQRSIHQRRPGVKVIIITKNSIMSIRQGRPGVKIPKASPSPKNWTKTLYQNNRSIHEGHVHQQHQRQHLHHNKQDLVSNPTEAWTRASSLL